MQAPTTCNRDLMMFMAALWPARVLMGALCAQRECSWLRSVQSDSARGCARVQEGAGLYCLTAGRNHKTPHHLPAYVINGTAA